MYRSAFWYWWRLKRRMRRAVAFAIRAALVISALCVAGLLLMSMWPEAGRKARDVFAMVEDRVRSFMGRVTDEVGSNRENVRQRISGRATAVDGDTLEVNGTRIRLHGIDAPENAQPCRVASRRWPCGRYATRALASQVKGKTVVCTVRDRDSYGRFVANCSTTGRDLNAWMVEEGWAFAYRRYSRAYVDEEARARAARRGVWRGEVVPPWKWRATQRR